MNCTGTEKRRCICKEYDIRVVGCYKLFGGRTVTSDAGGKIITDKYYFFKCIHKKSGSTKLIKCGRTAAVELCQFSGNTMPIEFDPFKKAHTPRIGAATDRYSHLNEVHWHQSRKQLYNAIMLFITRYGDILKADSAIYIIKSRVESNTMARVESRDVLAVNTILKGFCVTLSDILKDFSQTSIVRDFDFSLLNKILAERGEKVNNFR